MLVKLFTILVPFTSVAFTAQQPNPPDWPDSVRIFSPADPTSLIEDAVNSAFKINGGQKDHGQFSVHRFAFLFKPGSYEAQILIYSWRS
mmetsp:Transcript_14865/g.28287  ORF Transcript_14865/g.28287 Transcript_14865/m.28287 type:complete len:89 (+) Transcript_14865:698-964(+)